MRLVLVVSAVAIAAGSWFQHARTKSKDTPSSREALRRSRLTASGISDTDSKPPLIAFIDILTEAGALEAANTLKTYYTRVSSSAPVRESAEDTGISRIGTLAASAQRIASNTFTALHLGSRSPQRAPGSPGGLPGSPSSPLASVQRATFTKDIGTGRVPLLDISTRPAVHRALEAFLPLETVPLVSAFHSRLTRDSDDESLPDSQRASLVGEEHRDEGAFEESMRAVRNIDSGLCRAIGSQETITFTFVYAVIALHAPKALSAHMIMRIARLAGFPRTSARLMANALVLAGHLNESLQIDLAASAAVAAHVHAEFLPARQNTALEAAVRSFAVPFESLWLYAAALRLLQRRPSGLEPMPMADALIAELNYDLPSHVSPVLRLACVACRLQDAMECVSTPSDLVAWALYQHMRFMSGTGLYALRPADVDALNGPPSGLAVRHWQPQHMPRPRLDVSQRPGFATAAAAVGAVVLDNFDVFTWHYDHAAMLVPCGLHDAGPRSERVPSAALPPLSSPLSCNSALAAWHLAEDLAATSFAGASPMLLYCLVVNLGLEYWDPAPRDASSPIPQMPRLAFLSGVLHLEATDDTVLALCAAHDAAGGRPMVGYAEALRLLVLAYVVQSPRAGPFAGVGARLSVAGVAWRPGVSVEREFADFERDKDILGAFEHLVRSTVPINDA